MTSTRARTRAGNGAGTGERANARPARRPASPRSGDRFAAKRREDARRAGRRRVRLVVWLTAALSLAILTIGFVNSSWFDVDRVDVVGVDRADPTEIVAAAGIVPGQGLLDVDPDGAARSVELVPWVGAAEVTRAWTGEIVITIEERPPIAALPAGGGFALVDEHGRQLEIVDRRPDGFLPIVGVDASGTAGEPIPEGALPVLTVLGVLPPELQEQFLAIEVADGHLYLELVVGGRVDLGDGVDLGPKIQAMETLLARVDLRCLDTIDVRVPEAPVVTRTTPPPDAESGGGETTQSEPGENPDSDLRGC
ncbi:MAG: FtsQ-type POTRA domain-containing protein [Actinomycetota bacterium]